MASAIGKDVPSELNAASLLPRCSLTIGAVGHRETVVHGEIEMQVAATLDRLFTQIKVIVEIEAKKNACIQCYNYQEPLISLITSLAAGADVIAAETALIQDWCLDAVLPFSREDTALDCPTPEARQRFDRALEQTRSCLALGMPRGEEGHERNRAYDLSGQVLLGQCDVLIAIWDGLQPRGRGGTAERVADAIKQNTPVVWIDPAHPLKALLLRSMRMHTHPDDAKAKATQLVLDGAGPDQQLSQLIAGLIAPPPEFVKGAPGRHGEKQDRKAAERYFEFLFGDIAMPPRRKNSEQLRKLIDPFPKFLAESARQPLDRLVGAYEAADMIADHFARKFRHAVVLIFIAAAIAIAAPALTLLLPRIFSVGEQHDNEMMEHVHLGLEALEFVCLFFMVVRTRIGQRGQIHRRWIDARDLAERLRLSLTFWTLGIWPWQLATASEWVGWLTRAYVREQCLCPSVPALGLHVDENWKKLSLEVLSRLIDNQLGYHLRNNRRKQRQTRRFELVTKIFLGFTFLCLAAAILGGVVRWFDTEHHMWPAPVEEFLWIWLPSLAIILSAISFTTFGLKTTLDYEGVAERSRRAADDLQQYETALKDCKDVKDLHDFARALGERLQEERTHWRITAESRVLDMPG